MASVNPLKWHGGKFYLRQWIIGLMPPHLHYVEPFFGGGSVLLGRDPDRDWLAGDGRKLVAGQKGCSEVVNDIFGNLTNFWMVLQDEQQFAEFHRQVLMTPFSEIEFAHAMHATSDQTPVNRAVEFFIQARQSRQGLMKDFATLSRNRTRGGINEQVNSWLSVIDGLPDVHARLRKVLILNRPAIDVIRQQDGEHTLFYCDPPYLHETRSTTGEYAHEMSHDEHRELLAVLAGIKGKFMLSGYPSGLYEAWERAKGFRRHEQRIDNKASSKAVKDVKTECLWCNF